MTKIPKNTKLVLQDGSIFSGTSFGAEKSISGEVVFNTGMVGYPETFTDPSYAGQILVLTYPLIGNYGIPSKAYEEGLLKYFESDKIQIAGLVVSEYCLDFNHWQAQKSLGEWLKENNIPAIYGIDTRSLTKKLRHKGCMLGKIVIDKDVNIQDPNKENLVAKVSVRQPIIYKKGKTRILLVDCGCKNNIIRSLQRRNITIIRVPWDYDFFRYKFDGILISNGPGDPKQCKATIENIREAINRKKHIFGICLGNQILALAAGGDTYKLKFGHRSQNQPCTRLGGKRCFITSQNHGFAVDNKKMPANWKPWFKNANDGTNEGIIHKSGLFRSVQFHPEATPGPTDTEFLFDEFIGLLQNEK